MEASHSEAERNRVRDLALILFGYALHPEKRDEVLGVIQPHMIDSAMGRIYVALQNGNNEPIRTWFEQHDAAIGNGQGPVQAAISAIQRHNRKRQLKSVADQLRIAEKGLDAQSLATKLREIADDLEDTL